MIDLTTVELVSDAPVLDAWMEDLAGAALTAADEIGVFSALRTPRDSQELAETLHSDARGLDAVCRVLVACGWLQLRGDQFALTPASRLYWLPDAPVYRGFDFLRRRQSRSHQRILEGLREGWAPVVDQQRSLTEMWEHGDVSAKMATGFTRLMHSMILAPAIAAARADCYGDVRHMVDAGGGSGAFAIAFASHHPDKRATVMELAAICAEAQRYIEQWPDLSDRVATVVGNFFSGPWPADADAFFFSNVLHDWPVDRGLEILQAAWHALPEGGRVFVHEALLDEQRTAPKTTAVFNLMMHLSHRSQQFTEGQLASLLQSAGFEAPERVHTFGYYSLVTARKPVG